ncbi:MAG: hypothetical protein HYX28_03015 [Candidatus Koribacter versatilis]|uniref:Uncharacterized protein n=1 Tax=Candidatus Korobacter versatilis TaxID=658062 RepID=A0A932A7T2_9BACT|nr:hypothetical protein [Candidatus Koribacter versatilis]
MIFGFNTDIKWGDTVYHVQSEARKAEKLLQTQVFVRGRCIGKKATSYAEMEQQPDFTEDHMHDMLKVQHRGMLDGIRDGKLNEMLGLDQAAGGNGGAAAAGEPGGLAIQWMNSGAVYAESSVVMQFSVTEKGVAVAGAQLTSRLNVAEEAPIYSQAVTDANGCAEMKIFLDENALRDAAVLVQAKAGERVTTRKFVLKKN